MIRADIKTEISPLMGDEKQSEEMVRGWIEEFRSDAGKLWETNMFGKTFSELIGEDLNAKVSRLPDDARAKLQETLSRIINEGSGGLICIIL